MHDTEDEGSTSYFDGLKVTEGKALPKLTVFVLVQQNNMS
jgi:hypothetical protein